MSFTHHSDYKTREQAKLACEGKLCPSCLRTNIECVGSNPDGIHMNYAYDCKDCPAKWEGF